uniref:Uncharacterized protein n=1 Tax=Plectus sambesii TaxID=2011161 RepID=A0A914WWV1_9BILA
MGEGRGAREGRRIDADFSKLPIAAETGRRLISAADVVESVAADVDGDQQGESLADGKVRISDVVGRRKRWTAAVAGERRDNSRKLAWSELKRPRWMKKRISMHPTALLTSALVADS